MMAGRRPGRRKKLDTEADIEKVCFLYFGTQLSMRQVAEHLGVGIPTIDRVLKEHGGRYRERFQNMKARKKNEYRFVYR